jgi:hypothetical protein
MLRVRFFFLLLEYNTKRCIIVIEGSAFYQFCHKDEFISHLIFECVAAKYIWSNVGMAMGASDRPRSFTQFSSGSPNMFRLVETPKLLGWLLFAGLFGN